MTRGRRPRGPSSSLTPGMQELDWPEESAYEQWANEITSALSKQGKVV